MLVCGTAAGETPGGNHASDAGSHWSFRQVVQPPVPTPPHQAWVRNPIDAFLSIQHTKHGLVPQEPAPPYVLLRRIYMDLVGVPPTPEELADFTAQPTEEQKWSLKAMHRLMVTSTAYRMKSSAGAIMAENKTKDPDNVQLWRMNVRRSEAEVVRDSAARPRWRENDG